MLLFTFFTEHGAPKTGLSATITVWKDDGTVAVNAQAMTEIAGGWYKYNFAGYDESKDYAIRADGSAVLENADRYKYSSNTSGVVTQNQTNIESKIDTVDGNIDTILVDTSTDIPATISATESNIRGVDNDTLKTLSDQIDDTATLGTGAITWTYTVTSSVTGLPIADADVWVTTDEAGSNVVASGTTNQNGTVTFYLDAGTVYIWSQKSGYNFDNPDTEVVS